MNKDNVDKLIQRFFKNRKDHHNNDELIDMFTNNPSENLQQKFFDYYQKYGKKIQVDETEKEAIWDSISKELPSTGNSNRGWLLGAAAVVGSMIMFALLYNFHLGSSGQQVSKLAEHITLKSESGKIYASTITGTQLEPVAEAQLSIFGIQRDTTGKIAIVASAADRLLSTPHMTIKSKAGIERIELADGTNVWLNHNSTMSFPLIFKGRERVVTVVGEAYFEVAHNAEKPFLVRTAESTTKVLGTHFTVSAYPEASESVTLLEGSVVVSSKRSTLRLSPGERATYDNGKLERSTVDTTDLLAWQQGYFKFDDLTIEQLMDEIKVWYNVKDVVIKAKSLDRFSGTYKKSERIDDLLRKLERVSNLKFTTKKGGIYVLDK